MTVDPSSTNYVFPAETDVFAANAANGSLGAPGAPPAFSEAPAGADTALWGEDGFTFSDLIDLLNPLQHVPILSSLYRAVTGDDIAPAARMLGGGLYGGPLGLVSAMLNTAVDETTGSDVGGHLIALLDGDSSATTALARAINNDSPMKLAAVWPDADPAQPPTIDGSPAAAAVAVAANQPAPAPQPIPAEANGPTTPTAAYSEDDLAKAARLAKLTGENPRIIAERLAHLRQAQAAHGGQAGPGNQAVAALAGGAPTAVNYSNDDLAKAGRLAKLTGEDPRVIAERLARLRQAQVAGANPAGAAAGSESVTTSALPPRGAARSFVSYLPKPRSTATPVVALPAAPPAAPPPVPESAARPDPRLLERHEAYRNNQRLRSLFAAPAAGGA